MTTNLTKAELHRLRVEYGKDERLAYLGHLEVINTYNRCIRRARLPFSIGNGFARRMRIQFSQALPVGASSSCEYFDLRLIERIDPAEALAMLASATPKALGPRRAGYVDAPQQALEAWLGRADWGVELVGSTVDASMLAEGISRVVEQGTITYLRGDKEKAIDVASTLVGFEARDGLDGPRLALRTRAGETSSLRPQVLVDAAVGADAYDVLRVRRVGQWHEEDGRLVEPFDGISQIAVAQLS